LLVTYQHTSQRKELAALSGDVTIGESWLIALSQNIKQFNVPHRVTRNRVTRKETPLEQFVDGYFCEKCGKGFVSEKILKVSRGYYYK
jgi:hypothetical protein